jgi:hypothetical protein
MLILECSQGFRLNLISVKLVYEEVLVDLLQSYYASAGIALYYPLANEVAKGYSNASVRNILVNTLESTSFNGF